MCVLALLLVKVVKIEACLCGMCRCCLQFTERSELDRLILWTLMIILGTGPAGELCNNVTSASCTAPSYLASWHAEQQCQHSRDCNDAYAAVHACQLCLPHNAPFKNISDHASARCVALCCCKVCYLLSLAIASKSSCFSQRTVGHHAKSMLFKPFTCVFPAI